MEFIIQSILEGVSKIISIDNYQYNLQLYTSLLLLFFCFVWIN